MVDVTSNGVSDIWNECNENIDEYFCEFKDLPSFTSRMMSSVTSLTTLFIFEATEEIISDTKDDLIWWYHLRSHNSWCEVLRHRWYHLWLHRSNYFDTGISNPTFTLYVQKANLVKYGGRLVKVLGPLFWNELPTHIHVSASVQAFKEAVKKSYIAQYE